MSIDFVSICVYCFFSSVLGKELVHEDEEEVQLIKCVQALLTGSYVIKGDEIIETTIVAGCLR